MESGITTIKIRESARKMLRQIHVETDETIMDIVERLATGELAKLNRSKGMSAKWDVYETIYTDDKIAHRRLSTVEAGSASSACAEVTAAQWQSRTNLVAFPQGEKPQRFTVSKPTSQEQLEGNLR